MKTVIEGYKKKFGKDMVKDVLDDLGGDFKLLVQALFMVVFLNFCNFIYFKVPTG